MYYNIILFIRIISLEEKVKFIKLSHAVIELCVDYQYGKLKYGINTLDRYRKILLPYAVKLFKKEVNIFDLFDKCFELCKKTK